MRNPAIVSALDDLLDSLSRCLDDESTRRIAAFHVSPTVQARVEVLAEHANEGKLTAYELEEYDAFIDAADWIPILQLKAQQQLKSTRT